MLEVIIDRSKWNRAMPGKSVADTMGAVKLLNEAGNMCCLGFVSKSLGLKDEHIRDRAYPQSTMQEIKHLTAFNSYNIIKDTTLSCRAAGINDDRTLSPQMKEQRLKNLFLEHDIKLTFVGRTPKMEKIK